MIWVLTKTAQPSSFSNVKIFKTSSILAGSNPTIGSSTNKACGWIKSANNILSFCVIPLDNSLAMLFLFPVNLNNSRYLFAIS